MYYNTLKEILENKTVWVVKEDGEWHSEAVGVCFTRAEAEEFIINYKDKKGWYAYTVVEQPLGEAFVEFDERTKQKTIRTESELIAKKADLALRLEVQKEVEKKYDEILKPIRETIDRLIRRGV